MVCNKIIMKFKIISGYTIDTPYELEIKNLISSIKKYNINDYEIIKFNSFGSWTKNCQYKANIIYSQLKKINIPIVWLDADAILYDYPDLFDNIDEDIAFCDYYGGVASGTLYMRPTISNINLCEEWISLNSKNTNVFDQKNLTILIQKYNLKYFRLPVSYCKIDFAHCNEKIIIGQNQASRRFKKLINNKV